MKNVMVYREYSGSINYDRDEDCFHGRIEGIEDLITFEGRSVAELKRSFRESIEDYERVCAAAGKKPEKSYRGTFNVRISAELHREIARLSLKQGLTLNQFVKKALERSVGVSG